MSSPSKETGIGCKGEGGGPDMTAPLMGLNCPSWQGQRITFLPESQMQMQPRWVHMAEKAFTPWSVLAIITGLFPRETTFPCPVGISEVVPASTRPPPRALEFSGGTKYLNMGIITLGLVSAGILPSFQVPLWVITASAAAIALGTAVGGWKLIKTLGSKFYKIRPVHGFSTQVTSAIVILGASLIGGPVSTTQVVSSSIMGVGAAERLSKVRWGVAREIMIAWIITIPATAIMAAGIIYLLDIAPFLPW